MKAITPKVLLKDLRELIAEARQDVARQVNSALVLLYWRMGKRIRQDILKEKRAGYGEQIVSAVSRELAAEFGQGFSEKNLWHMIRFVEVFRNEEIVSALRRELSWTHFKQIIYLDDPLKYLDDPLKRDFYTEMCRIECWSVRTLEKKISGMLFERTALSEKPEKLIREELDSLRIEDKLTPDLVFRDPYFLDLLFYHRGLKRLVAIDLKLGDFKPGDKGQMELYLRWLAKYEQKPDEETPIRLILCAGKKKETVELLELEKSRIRVASYWTKVLPRKLFQKKLHEAIQHARTRLAQMERLNGKKLLSQQGTEVYEHH